MPAGNGNPHLIVMTISTQTEDRRNRIANHLSKLIAICKDGQAGYRAVAHDAKDPELIELFTRLADQRAQFATQLQELVRDLRCEPHLTASFTGAFHRGWINIKSAAAINDAHAALAECERGEDAVIEAYRKVLEEAPLDGGLRAVIGTQAIALKDMHDEVRFLRDLPVYGTSV